LVITSDSLVVWIENMIDQAIILEIKKLKISVAPNPAKKLVRISANFDIDHIEIFSTIGKRVIHAPDLEIDVSQLDAGVYIVQVHGNNSQGILTKKLIVQR
jgi:hypothetical protein